MMEGITVAGKNYTFVCNYKHDDGLRFSYYC